MTRPPLEHLTAAVAETARRSRAIAELSRVVAYTRDRELFWRGRRLQRLSRESFRAVSWHPTRWWEFPWIYRAVERRAAGRLPWLAHLGGDLSPLPIVFGRMEMTIQVIGRGEVDYGRWGLHTQRVALSEARFPLRGLGFAVSVATLAAAPPRERAAIVEGVAAGLEPGGVLVFTAALDRARGLRPGPGGLDALLTRLDAAGLELELEERSPVPDGGGAVAGLILRKRE